MDEPLPPDPYAALGLESGACENDVKSAYRKLALKCHPDKFPDAAMKRIKEEEFHKISQAYELLSDPEKKGIWEMNVQLHDMRKRATEQASKPNGNSSRNPDIPVSGYKTRTCQPSFATPTAAPQERHAVYDEEDYHNKSRRTSTKYYERPSARSEKESTRAATDKKRAEQKKAQDKTKRSERSERTERHRMESSDSDNAKTSRSKDDEKLDKLRQKYADAERDAQDRIRNIQPERKRSEDSRRYRDSRDREYSRDRDHVYSGGDYHSRPENERPSAHRTSSSSSSRYEMRGGDRPATVRRSRAEPKDRSHDRYRTTIVEEPEEIDYEKPKTDRRMPSMPSATSSPAALHVPPQDSPRRSYSYQYPLAQEASPKVNLNRAETMPTGTSSSSRRRDVPSSKHQEDSGYSSPGTPETTYPQNTYPRAQAAGEPNVRYVSADDYKPQFVVREPGNSSHARYTSSPKRMSSDRERSPKVSSRPSYTEAPFTAPPLARSTTYSYADKVPSRPSIPIHTSTSQVPRVVEEYPDRGRDRDRGRSRDHGLAYGEIDKDAHRAHERVVRPEPSRKTSYRPDEINYARKISPADIRYRDSKDRDRDRDRERELYEEGIKEGARRYAAQLASENRERYDSVPHPGLSRRGTVY